jgi:FlaG/FlaF family flagellin (archaellin)
MQLMTITAILAAAMSASATPMVSRQAPSSVTGTFYNNKSGCHGDTTGVDYTFVQDAPGVCHDLAVPVPGTITDTDFSLDTLTRSSK